MTVFEQESRGIARSGTTDAAFLPVQAKQGKSQYQLYRYAGQCYPAHPALPPDKQEEDRGDQWDDDKQ